LMKKIVFVCKGNIFRSPVAEYIFKKILDKRGIKDVKVESAGTSAKYANKKISDLIKIFPEENEVVKKTGVDIGDHVITFLDSKLVKESYKIIVFNRSLKDEVVKNYPEAKNKVFILKEIIDEKNVDMEDLKGKPLEDHTKFVYELRPILEKVFSKVIE